MNTIEKYNQIFREALGITEETPIENLNYQEIEEWDSVGHMTLVAEMEEAFDIMMEMDDILDFSSYQKGKEILGKYNIIF